MTEGFVTSSWRYSDRILHYL